MDEIAPGWLLRTAGMDLQGASSTILIMVRFLIPLLLACSIAWSDGPATTRASSPYARQLAAECDQVIGMAFHRPYGWAWSEEREPDSGVRGKGPRPVMLAPLASPATALMLLQASDLLDEPRFARAAQQVARGVAAAQQPSGKFPGEALFGPTVTTRERPTALPSRLSTCASLALLLSIADRQTRQDDPIWRAAARGASWLMKQQADTGAWPVLDPPDAASSAQVRIVRLDLPETRDSIFTMILAADVLGDPIQRRAAEKSLEFLHRIRVPDGNQPASGTWSTAYTLSGMAVADRRYPTLIDCMATRHGIQASLAGYMVLGNGQNAVRARNAAKALAALPREQDRWWPRYSIRGERYISPEAASRPGNSSFGEPVQDTPPDLGLRRTLKVVERIGERDRAQWLAQLKTSFMPRQVLALSIAGFLDGDLPLDFSANGDDLPAYLERNRELFATLSDPPPANLHDRTMRLWALYLRAMIEQRFGR